MDKKRWYLGALVACAVLVFVWWWYAVVYQHLQQQIEIKSTSVVQLKQKKELLPDLRYQVDVLRQHNDQIQQELQSIVLNQNFVDPYVLLEHVLGNIDDLGLRLVLLTPQDFKRKAFYEKYSFSFKVLGSYDRLMKLLDHFCEKHPNAVLKKVDITRAEDKLLLEALVTSYVVDRDGL